MTKPVEFKYEKTPLKEAIEDLKELLAVPIVLETKVLEEAAINREKPISGKSRGGTALDDVNDLLRPYKLEAEIHHNVLIVTTMEKHATLLVCRAYRLKKVADAKLLTEQIEFKIGRDSWSDVGGPGSIAGIGAHVLMIRQTPAIHREIEKAFEKDLLSAKTPPDRVAALAPTKGVDPLAKMRNVLHHPESVDFPEIPFGEAVEWLATNRKIPLVLDRNAFAVAVPSFNLETPVTINFKELPLETILTLMLSELHMDWSIDREQILITTTEVAKARLLTIAYDVRDLTSVADGKSLTQALMRTVQPASWSDVGGPGKISAAEGELSITQTVQVHRIIETWLADLRTALKP
jgi:hypothetical protein